MAIRMERILEKDGEIVVTGLPYKKGQHVKVVVSTPAGRSRRRPYMKASDLLKSELVGMWKDRADISDSVDYARQLRDQAQNRPSQ